MTRDTQPSKVETAALSWIRARIERDRLHDERAKFLCVHEPVPQDESLDAGGQVAPQQNGRACWKGHHEPETEHGGGEWVTERDPDEWCEPCKARQLVHVRYVAARHLTRGRLGALNRVCRAAVAALAQEGSVPP